MSLRRDSGGAAGAVVFANGEGKGCMGYPGTLEADADDDDDDDSRPRDSRGLSASAPSIPDPIMLRPNEIEDLLDGKGKYPGYYKPLRRPWNTQDVTDLKIGMEVLWASPGVGRRGGPSTKIEHFHGTFHVWDAKYPEFAIVS